MIFVWLMLLFACCWFFLLFSLSLSLLFILIIVVELFLKNVVTPFFKMLLLVACCRFCETVWHTQDEGEEEGEDGEQEEEDVARHVVQSHLYLQYFCWLYRPYGSAAAARCTDSSHKTIRLEFVKSHLSIPSPIFSFWQVDDGTWSHASCSRCEHSRFHFWLARRSSPSSVCSCSEDSDVHWWTSYV